MMQSRSRADRFWGLGFPIVLLVLAVLTGLLWIDGTRAVLTSTDGDLVETESDPNAPGYQAFLVPTPTMLALHVDAEDALVGISVMAQTLLDNGGEIVLLPAGSALDSESDATLAELFTSGGADAVRTVVESAFGFGIDSAVVVSAEQLAQIVEVVAPLSLELIDPLVETDSGEVWLDDGPQELDGPAAARLFAFTNDGEAEINRTERRADLWEALFAAANSTALTAVEDEFAGFVDVLASELSLVEVAPVVPSGNGGETIYVLNEAGAARLAADAQQMVPLPALAEGSTAPSIRLLNGTTNPAVGADALDSLAWEAAVLIIGNTADQASATSTIVYHRESAAEQAEALGALLTASVRADIDDDELVDITVTIGADWQTP